MPRLLVGGVWYDAISSGAFWEREYEEFVAQYADSLFPSWFFVPFKMDVESEYGTARPDGALIDRAYRSWWVVEAELAHHSLVRHVSPQVRKLAHGDYKAAHAEYLRSRRTDLDLASLKEMLKGQQPRVLVMVNAPVPDWRPELSRHNALVMILEVFRSATNKHVLRLNGEYPTTPPQATTRCRWDATIPRFLKVESPTALGSAVGGRYAIEYEGSVTEWARVETGDTVWLNPVKSVAVPSDRSFVVESVDGRLVMRAVKARRE